VSRVRSSEHPAGHRAADTVADAVLRRPKVLPAAATVGQARAALADDHVHAMPVVDAGVLLAVVERADLEGVPDATPAALVGRLEGRTVDPDADLTTTWAGMAAEGRRRLAVVDAQWVLLGLLCLKRHGRGFCSAADVVAREADRRRSEVAETVEPDRARRDQ
jgi:CBS-domain-containing membrane protein